MSPEEEKAFEDQVDGSDWAVPPPTTAMLKARIEELEAALRETGAVPTVVEDEGPPTHDYLECWWCHASTELPEDPETMIPHAPDCRLVALGLVVPERGEEP